MKNLYKLSTVLLTLLFGCQVDDMDSNVDSRFNFETGNRYSVILPEMYGDDDFTMLTLSYGPDDDEIVFRARMHSQLKIIHVTLPIIVERLYYRVYTGPGMYAYDGYLYRVDGVFQE